MGGQLADVRSAATGVPAQSSARLRNAFLFGLLFAVQFGAAILTPLGADESEDYWEYLILAAIGFSVAWPPLLAVWTVFGPQRGAIRLPLTLWLAAAISLAALYGFSRSVGEESPQLLIINAAWLAAFIVLQVPLWAIRAVRRWRLERPENGAAKSGRAASKTSSQFTLRALLGWTLAVASLLAVFRWLMPEEGMEAELALALLVESGVIGLFVALGGLPVVALAWIMLADGRRPKLRIVLGLLIVLGIASAGVFFEKFSQGLLVSEMLCVVGATMLNGLVSFGVVRASGYQLRRRAKKTVAAEAMAPAAVAPVTRVRFAFAAAPLIVIAAGLACSIPHRLEMWRRAELGADWRRSGVNVSFDDEGKIVQANYWLQEPITDEICGRISTLGDLAELDLNKSQIDDRKFALLAPLPNLTKLNLSATAVTDAAPKHLGRFPHLVDLNLSNTSITDAGLKRLQAFPKLQSLQLCLTDVSDEGLSALEQLPELRSVDVQLSAVTPAGAEKLRKANPQAKVEFGASDALLAGWQTTTRTVVTNVSGVQSIGVVNESIKVKRLHARGKILAGGVPAGVTDAGLVTLSVVQTDLEELDLRESEVTDQGIMKLRALKNLKHLDLRGSPVTEQGVQNLARVLPDCEILR
jgi:hypothetical protein